MDPNGVAVRAHGYFTQRYTILPAESKAQLGCTTTSPPTSTSKSTNATTTNSAGGITDFTDEQFICAFHNSTKKHAAKSEREKGPRQHIRRLSFCFRHKRGAIEEEGREQFAARCVDAGFPQLKLWLALHDGVSLERVPIKLQAVTDVWVEIEETVPAASSNLIPVAPQEKNNYSHEAFQRRQARRQLGIDDDEEETLIQSLMQMEETRLHAYVAFERYPPNIMSLRAIHALKQTRRQRHIDMCEEQHQQQQQAQHSAVANQPTKPDGTTRRDSTTFDAFNYSATSIESALARHAKQRSANPPQSHSSTATVSLAKSPSDDVFGGGGHSLAMAWSSAELTLILSHVSQFAKLTTQFTRKGSRRRSGTEPTIMLDIDEDHVFGQLDEDIAEDSHHHQHHTGAHDGDDTTSIPRVFRVFLPISVIETCCKLRDNRYVQSPSIVIIQHDYDASVWNRATFPTATPLTGAGAEAAQNTHHNTSSTRQNSGGQPLPPAEKPPARTAMVGIKSSMFLLGLMLLKYSVRDDCDIATLRLSPPMKKPPFLLDDDGQFRHEATYRSVLMQLVDGEDTHRPGPSQVLEALREEGCGTFRSRRGSVFPPNVPLTSLTSPGTSPTRLGHSEVTSPAPPTPSRKPASSTAGHNKAHSGGEQAKTPARAPITARTPPMSAGIPHSGSSSRLLEERTLVGMVTLAQRQRDAKATLPKNAILISSSLNETSFLNSASHYVSGDAVQKALLTETKFETNQRDTIRRIFAASAHQFPPPQSPASSSGSPRSTTRKYDDGSSLLSSDGSGGNRQTPPGSSESTRQTAETAANDTRPIFTSSGHASRLPVSTIFEL